MSKWNRADFLNKTQIKERGWTDLAMKRFLPEPEHSTQNPYHRAGPLICFWRCSTVEGIEQTRDFIGWREESARAKAAAAKAVKTKSQRLMDYVNSLTIVVPQMDQAALLDACPDARASRANPERAAVNFLRHECTDYEYELDRLAGHTGKEDALALLRGKIYAAIAFAYPDLEEECQDQADQRDALWEFRSALDELEESDETEPSE